MKRALFFSGAFLATGVAFYATSSCGSLPPSLTLIDGARDVAASDGPADRTGRDATLDATLPPLADATVSLPGDWIPLAGMPEGCGLRVAKDPTVAIRPFPWKPCANGISGCISFLADWGVPHNQFQPQRLEAAYEDGSGVHLASHRTYAINPAGGETFVLVHSMEGPAESAFRMVNGCVVNIHASRFGLAIAAIESSARGYVGHANSLRATDVRMVRASVSPTLFRYQGITRWSDYLVVEANGGPSVTTSAYPFSSEQFVAASPGHGLPLELPIPLPDGYFALAATNPPTIVFAPLAGGNRTVVRPSQGVVTYYGVDRAAGNALVWTEATSEADHVFWTAPYATTEGALARRAIARAPFENGFVANAGVVAIVVGPKKARIIRLSDGMGWDVPAETGMDYIQPLWVNDDAIWLHASAPIPPAEVLFGRGAVKIPRSALGAPTVAPGL